MSDQCENCQYRGVIDSCLSVECNHHESWYAGLLQAKLAYRTHEIFALEDRIAERNTLLEQHEATIVEQQARIEEMLDVGACMRTPNDLPALKAALKAERINTLKDAAGHFADTPKGREVKEELTRMANALKEQS